MNLFNDSDSETEPLGADLIPPAPILQPRIASTTFDGLLPAPLKLHEDLKDGCGGIIWPAGELLAKYCLRRYSNGDALKGKKIVEIGAGGGLVGLALAAGCDIQGTELVLTDIGVMVELMKKNVALNGFEDRVKVELLDWQYPLPQSITKRPVDIVLAADCVYFEPAFPWLEQTLVDLVRENTVVLFCFKKRRRADLHFIKSIKKRLNVREVKDDMEYAKEDMDHVHYSRENLYLYVMTKKI